MRESQADLFWHFLPADRRLRWGSRELVEVGSVTRMTWPYRNEDDKEDYHGPATCSAGLHASRRAIDALQYAPGPICCRVRLSGRIVEDTDKAAADERHVLAMADVTKILHEFACRCAESALKATKVEDPRAWKAIEVKRAWLRGEAFDRDLDAASSAARATARAAARDAAWDAARDAQNQMLESMLNEAMNLEATLA